MQNAKLLLEWSAKNDERMKAEPRVTLGLPHEETAQMIGTSRETVMRIFGKMKKQIVLTEGSMLVTRDKTALKALADTATVLPESCLIVTFVSALTRPRGHDFQ